MATASYRASLGSLYERRRFGLRPGLEVIRALLAELGEPQRRFPSIHVTGSKGKGSVAAIAEAVLSAHGRRVGLYTSPHLVHYNERMRIGGEPLAPREISKGLDRVLAAERALLARGSLERPATFFEATTALAFDRFGAGGVDAGVIEVGIGGRLDATNVLDARVGVVTTLELEHTDLLGPTIAAIAEEKAGIFHPGMTGILGALPPDGLAVVERVAARERVPLWHLGREFGWEERALDARGQRFTVRLPGARWDALHTTLAGSFQPGNAAMAIAACARFAEAEGFTLLAARVADGLSNVRWRARLERIAHRPSVYLDVAHTPESVRAVVHSLAELDPFLDPARTAVLFGCLADKDAGAMLTLLAPLARTLVLTPVRSERSATTGALRALAAGQFPVVVLARSAVDGLALAGSVAGADGTVLAIGSDYLAAELLRTPGDGEEPDLSDPGRAPEERPPPAPSGRGR